VSARVHACVALGPLRINLVAFVVALSCMPYLLMNIAVTNPIVRIRNCDTPGAYLHVHVKQSSRTRLSQPVSYVAPPRAQHTHIAVGGLEYLISLMSSRLE
jgi:hypothetical protein